MLWFLCKCVEIPSLFHQSVILNILSLFFKLIVGWFGHIASCTMCPCAQLMAPVYTPVFQFPQSLVPVRVPSKQLTLMQLCKPLQQNMLTAVIIDRIS